MLIDFFFRNRCDNDSIRNHFDMVDVSVHDKLVFRGFVNIDKQQSISASTLSHLTLSTKYNK